MKRTVICVDAGYLFAQGSVALSGTKQPRTLLVLDAGKVFAELKAVAESRAPENRLLRLYWYDGALGLRPTLEQEQLAHLDDIKVRLGFINSVGQQKGVDSLIVTDLIELARLGAICDAILLSGGRGCTGRRTDCSKLRSENPSVGDSTEPGLPIKGTTARSRHHK
jgi:hypothetical protein